MIREYAAAMISTVKAVASARKGASATNGPSALNDSSGPYDEDERPSAPSPTQARNATSDTWRKTPGSSTLRGRPTSQRRIRRLRGGGSPGGGTGDGSALLGSNGVWGAGLAPWARQAQTISDSDGLDCDSMASPGRATLSASASLSGTS